MTPGGRFVVTTLIGATSVARPMVTPPRIMQREVIHAPASILTGAVTSAMSTRWACEPVVIIVSCDSTTSSPTTTSSWLWIHTPSPIQQLSPMVSFQGKRTRVRGRKITPRPTRAPKHRSTNTRTREDTCRAFVTKSHSQSPQAYTTKRPRPQAERSPGASLSGMTGNSLDGGLGCSNASLLTWPSTRLAR